MKRYFKTLFIPAMLIASFACNKQFDGLLNNPNYPSPTTADVDLYLNAVQLSFKDFYNSASDFGAQLSRMNYWSGPQYSNAYQPASFDGEWEQAYTGVINNANSLIPLAETQQKYIQAGIARILKAYTMGTLVDDFGDVPNSEAELGADNTNPKADAGADVYASVQSLLDSAIIDLNTTGATSVSSDLFYNGSASKWLALANTLKLKFYMQVRLVDNSAAAKIQALISDNNLINTSSQDFVFQYGKNTSTPDSRHPHYGGDYANGGGADYLSNYFMWKVLAQKYSGTVTILTDNTTANNADPRGRYYFYREVANSASFSQTSVPCYYVPGPPSWYPTVPQQTPFCYCGKGYFGRDYGDNSGTSPDQGFRTGFGIYPVGGEFDANQYKTISLGLGSGGNGINPIWLSSYTQFLKAEAAAIGITSDDPATLLQSGIDASISKVLAFPTAIGYTIPASFVPTSTQISAYETNVMNIYTSGTSAEKLDLIMSEYYIALWGNGVEAYNNLRRTGSPADVQLAVATPTPGLFIRSFLYPSVYVNRNQNAPAQKVPGTAANKVFWDNNPDDFIK
ncbi:MAG: SusD/RagB family nutrient-binding outer membrane lipoprotein [Bacteroidetes bacterium]|nr:SusD/RagB family nutrient-binding outer membrane lipoprotein [Bacteroidota bacterium]